MIVLEAFQFFSYLESGVIVLIVVLISKAGFFGYDTIFNLVDRAKTSVENNQQNSLWPCPSRRQAELQVITFNSVKKLYRILNHEKSARIVILISLKVEMSYLLAWSWVRYAGIKVGCGKAPNKLSAVWWRLTIYTKAWSVNMKLYAWQIYMYDEPYARYFLRRKACDIPIFIVFKFLR